MENLINNLLIKKKKIYILQKKILQQSLEDYKKIHQINCINLIETSSDASDEKQVVNDNQPEENSEDVINLIETSSDASDEKQVVNDNQPEENSEDVINLIETSSEASDEKQVVNDNQSEENSEGVINLIEASDEKKLTCDQPDTDEVSLAYISDDEHLVIKAKTTKRKKKKKKEKNKDEIHKNNA